MHLLSTHCFDQRHDTPENRAPKDCPDNLHGIPGGFLFDLMEMGYTHCAYDWIDGTYVSARRKGNRLSLDETRVYIGSHHS